MNNNLSITSAVICLALTTSCVPVVATTGAVTAATVTEERTLGTAVDDAAIKTELAGRFFNKDIDNLFMNISTVVDEGRVLLTGHVANPETAVDAVKIAWSVSGVKEVINEIQVTERHSLTQTSRDIYIKSRIKGQLLLDKHIRSVNYNVEVLNGVVYLIGIAINQAELNKVTYIASHTPYVSKVVNFVRLRNDPMRGKAGKQ